MAVNYGGELWRRIPEFLETDPARGLAPPYLWPVNDPGGEGAAAVQSPQERK